MTRFWSLLRRKASMTTEFSLNVVTLCGSVRKDSYNAALLRALPSLSTGDLIFKEGPSVADIPIYDHDLERLSGFPSVISALAASIREADGVLIASPEYNYSIPGGLKNMIDWLSRTPNQPFSRKPVLLQSVSGGTFGGVRMQHHLRQVMVFVNARVMPRPEVMIGPATTKFDEAGQLIDKPTREAVRVQLTEFAAFIREGFEKDRR
jgi:chromate reductase, NAD(P)H dehydrogenase (quinone)